MSMLKAFLMEQQKIMYATIKGTLTENNGVFSGFSGANYLALQQTLDTSKPFEVVIKVRYVGDSNKYFFGKIGYSITVGTTTVDNNRRFKAFFSSNGTSWNIGNITTTVNLTTNTDYYVKVGFTGTKYYIEQSTDGKNYVGYAELSSSENIISGNLLLGKSYIDEQYWNGTIDLNKSYIKLGSTKYKLQAVVGYTIVGSPTITDGVVSGFSSSNYLITNQILDTSKNFEIVIKANTGNLNINTNDRSITRNNYNSLGSIGYSFGIKGNTNNIITYLIDTEGVFFVNGTIGQTTFQNNTDYMFRFSQKKIDNNYVTKVEYSSDNGNSWIVENTFEHNLPIRTSGVGCAFGVGARTQPNQFWNGSIDIANSYIKVNNKLWFNGQQA